MLKMLSLGLILLALTGCKTTGETRSIPITSSVNVACQSFKPIIYGGSTIPDEVKVQLKAHNAVWLELCAAK